MKLDIRKGEPLKLPSGDIVLPKSMTDDAKTGIKHAALAGVEEEMREILGDPFAEVTYQRTLADINVPFNRFSMTMVCVSMSMWGLDAHAISRILELPVESIQQVQDTQLFTELRQQIVEALRYAESGTIHGYLQQKALKAAKTVASALDHKSPDVSLKAAQDVLDRTGFRPVDRVEHSHRFEDDLRIVMIQEQELPDAKFKMIDN